MTKQGFYNTEKFERKNRSIRLNEITQKVPAGPLKVIGMRKQKSQSGIEYPILILEDQDRSQYDVFAWERDVIECGREWGDMDPTDWGYVQFQLASNKTRFELVPCNPQPMNKEDNIER